MKKSFNKLLIIFWIIYISVFFIKTDILRAKNIEIQYTGEAINYCGEPIDKTIKMTISIYDSKDRLNWTQDQFVTVTTEGGFNLNIRMQKILYNNNYFDGKHYLLISNKEMMYDLLSEIPESSNQEILITGNYFSKVSKNKLSIADLPGIMRTKNWGVAAVMMEHWFKGSGRNKYIHLTKIKKLLNSAKTKIKEYQNRDPQNFLNIEMANYLIKELKKTDYNGKKVLFHGGRFNHINTEIKLAKNLYHDLEWEKQNMHWIFSDVLQDDDLSEYTAAFNKAVLRIVAAGFVQVHTNKKGALIYVNKVGLYFRDSYDFRGEQSFLGFNIGLGCWSTKPPYVSFFSSELNDPKICVENSTFRQYNKDNKRKENYGEFRIFSRPEDCVIRIRQMFDYDFESGKITQ